MTLDEAIKHAEGVAEENQRVVDTGIVFDDVTIDMLYCDDTEVIEEHLANYQRCANEHRQLAEWLKDYKRLLEQEPCDDAISREDALMCLTGEIKETDTIETIIARFVRRIRNLPPVNPQPKTGHWIIKDSKEQGYDIGGVKTWYIQIKCSECGFIKTAIEGHTGQYHYCPNCGAKMIESQESEEQA